MHESPSAISGHYHCDVVSSPHEQTGLAYKCDDTVCSRLGKEALDPDINFAYMHIYELVPGNEDVPVANTIGNRKVTTMAVTAAENQPKRQRGLLAASDEQFNAWVEQAEKILCRDPAERSKDERRALKWLQKMIKKVKENYPDAEEPGLSAGNAEQQQGGRGLRQRRGGLQAANAEQRRGRRLPASGEPQNGKLICRGSDPSKVESCTEEDEGRKRLEEQPTKSHCAVQEGARVQPQKNGGLQLDKTITKSPSVPTKAHTTTEAVQEGLVMSERDTWNRTEVKYPHVFVV